MDADENDEDCVISLNDLVNENEMMELEEMTMRGQASEEECTYNKGYMNRQGIFSCKTCQDNGCLPAAICYGCSIQCHSDHDLYELWSKRNYRCDCGNERFPELTCQLKSDKDSINVKNNYDNHNLRGLYCTCECSYNGDTNMISCVICEDWFHFEHIDIAELGEQDDAVIICPACSNKFMALLIPYFPLYCQSYVQTTRELFSIEDVDSLLTTASSLRAQSSDDNKCILPLYANQLLGSVQEGVTEEVLQRELQLIFDGSRATIWQLNWRDYLCKCSKCVYTYELEGLSFLIDPTDTIEHYLSKAKTTDDDIKLILEKLNRPMQIEVISMMREFREQLQEFFRTCSETGKVVTERDVIEFFEKMKSELQNRNILPDRCNQPYQ
ncbi:hypothetical protein GJ496_001471 [Pomphorhynchus laevis]|nr:hypothetical protein GJ496_001471 [Pomphorhynchus laevis]